MSLHSIRVSLLAMATAIILAACGGSGTSNKPAPPVGGLTSLAGDSQVTLSWVQTPGVEYWIFAAPNNANINLSNWLATSGSIYRMKVTSPFVVTGLSNGTPYSFFLTGRINGGAGGDATPTVTVTPRLAGIEWKPGVALGTGTTTGLTYGTYLDAATNSYLYKYVAVGQAGRMASAAEIGTWSTITPFVSSNLNAAEFGFSKYMAVGDGGNVIYSSDTKTWTAATSITSNALNALLFNGSLVVAVGNNGTLIKSSDGIIWTLPTAAPSTTAHLNALAFSAAGKWVAVGAAGTIMTSDDGLTWTARTSGTTADLKAVGSISTYLNGTTTYTYLAVGANGTILTSPDAITWTARSANTTATLNALSAQYQFMVVGSNGTIISSNDGITWTAQVSGTTANLKTLFRAENQYIAVTDTGNVLYSR